MKLTMLGTGSAGVTECYHTCFTVENEGEYLLVDGGGGNLLLNRLKSADIRWQDIRHVFVTHVHTDHLLGIFWLMRAIHYSKPQDLDGKTITFYGHDEVITLLRDMTVRMFPREDVLHPAIRFEVLEDGQEFYAVGHRLRAFDVGSAKTKQFGFSLYYGEGEKLTCCGDEPYHECEREYAQGSTWLLHEAFCLKSEADIFHPYEKQHSTVTDACQTAEQLGVKNLLLYHTEEKNLSRRRELYAAEGRQYFSGNIVVPDDLDVLTIE